jgi:hypothetical protein
MATRQRPAWLKTPALKPAANPTQTTTTAQNTPIPDSNTINAHPNDGQIDNDNDDGDSFSHNLTIRNFPQEIIANKITVLLPEHFPYSPTNISTWNKKNIQFCSVNFKTFSQSLIFYNSLKSLTHQNIPIAISYYRVLSCDPLSRINHAQQSFTFFGKKTTNLLQFDEESIFSVSPQEAAILTTLLISLFVPDRSGRHFCGGGGNKENDEQNAKKSVKSISILDGCACVGGDTISFAKMPQFGKIYALLHASLLKPVMSDEEKSVEKSVEKNEFEFEKYELLPQIETSVTSIEFDQPRSLLLSENINTVGLNAEYYDCLDGQIKPNLKFVKKNKKNEKNEKNMEEPNDPNFSSNQLTPITQVPLPSPNNVITLSDSFVYLAKPELRFQEQKNQKNDEKNDEKIYNSKIFPQVLFLDPPWGGKDYISQSDITLKFDIHSVGDLLRSYIQGQYLGVEICKNDEKSNNKFEFLKEKNAQNKTELIILKCPINVNTTDLLLPLIDYRRELYNKYQLNADPTSPVSNNDNNAFENEQNNTKNEKNTHPSIFIQRLITPKIAYFIVSIPDLDLSPPSPPHYITPSLPPSTLPTLPTLPTTPLEALAAILSSPGVTDLNSFNYTHTILNQLLFNTVTPSQVAGSDPGLGFEVNVQKNDNFTTIDGFKCIKQLWIERIVEAWGVSYDLFDSKHYTSPTVEFFKVPQWYQDQKIVPQNDPTDTHSHPNSTSPSQLINSPENSSQLNYDSYLAFSNGFNQSFNLNSFVVSNSLNTLLDVCTTQDRHTVSFSRYIDQSANHIGRSSVYSAYNPMRDVTAEISYRTTGSISQIPAKRTYIPRSQLGIKPVSTGDNGGVVDVAKKNQFKVDLKNFSDILSSNLRAEQEKSVKLGGNFESVYEKDRIEHQSRGGSGVFGGESSGKMIESGGNIENKPRSEYKSDRYRDGDLSSRERVHDKEDKYYNSRREDDRNKSNQCHSSGHDRSHYRDRDRDYNRERDGDRYSEKRTAENEKNERRREQDDSSGRSRRDYDSDRYYRDRASRYDGDRREKGGDKGDKERDERDGSKDGRRPHEDDKYRRDDYNSRGYYDDRDRDSGSKVERKRYGDDKYGTDYRNGDRYTEKSSKYERSSHWDNAEDREH